jgi:hypothetical protein
MVFNQISMRNIYLPLGLILGLSASANAQSNVGVDVPSPQEKLDVAGRLRLSSDNSAGAPTGGAGTIRWNATAGQFQGWNGTAWVSFASTIETDPVFSASPSFGITNTNITNWNTAFGWGNHATAGYLTSFTELDPVFSASPSFGITNTNITNWNTAFGWGNHATAGYLTSFTELDPTWDGAANFTGDINRTGNVGIGGAPSEKLHVTGNVRATSGFIANDGSAGTPAVRFASSPSTGIFRPAADALGISTVGTERVRVAASGNVGIGITAEPAKRLEVNGDIILSRMAAGGTPGIRELTVQSSNADNDAGDALHIRAGSANVSTETGAGGNLLLEAGSGNSAGAHVAGNVLIRSGSNTFGSGTTNGHIILETGAVNSSGSITERMRIANNGDITLPTLAHPSENRLLTVNASTGQLALSSIIPSTVGTVTSVSVTTANGVSGIVATATTTPAISLTLGAITPSSVAASGTVTGSNLSGSNTGDQTITLTGDVTGSGTGSFATTIANNAVTSAKILDGTIVNADIANSTIDITQKVTGILPIGNGGTNSNNALNNNRVMVSTSGAIREHAALTANLPIFTDANGLPTTTAPTTGVQGFWTRTGTLLHNSTLTDNVGIGTNNPLSTFHIATSQAGNVVKLHNSTLANGSLVGFEFGKANSNNNMAEFRYNHVSDGSSANWINLGLWGNANTLNIVASGRVGVLTNDPRTSLSVAGGLGIGTGDGLSATHGARRSLQINSDNNYGGANDNHSGFLMYATMPGGWGTARLHFAHSDNWGSYDTGNPALTIDDSGLSYGISGSNTSRRDNAGLQGNAGARSGFYETETPTNYYSGASSWQHLLDVRHNNPSNNYAMQFAGSFFDQDFYARKTNNSASEGWGRIVTSRDVVYSQNRNTFAHNNANEGYRTTGVATGAMNVKIGDVITIMHTSKFRWTGGSGGDHPFYGIRITGCASTNARDSERIGTADDVPRGQWQSISGNYVWVSTCNGTVQFQLEVDNNSDADDSSEYRDIVIIATRH